MKVGLWLIHRKTWKMSAILMKSSLQNEPYSLHPKIADPWTRMTRSCSETLITLPSGADIVDLCFQKTLERWHYFIPHIVQIGSGTSRAGLAPGSGSSQRFPFLAFLFNFLSSGCSGHTLLFSATFGLGVYFLCPHRRKAVQNLVTEKHMTDADGKSTRDWCQCDSEANAKNSVSRNKWKLQVS